MDEPEPVYRASADRGDHLIAHQLAVASGELLVTLRAEADCADLAAEGDRRSDDFLQSELAVLRPADAVLSEESVDDVSRLRASRVWIIDPLDGTREFAEPGRRDWAVHVALWADGALAAGAARSRPGAVDPATGSPGS